MSIEIDNDNDKSNNIELEQDKKDWKELQDSIKVKEDEIERYCHKIRGTIRPSELPFEEYRKQSSEDWKLREEILEKIEREEEEEANFQREKPEGMARKQWQKEKSRRRLLKREEVKAKLLDEKFLLRNTPHQIFIDRLHKVQCECTAIGIRQGIYCQTCKLIIKVNEYTMQLFKDAAEGKITIV
jgi:hypothetical protein